MAEILLSLTIIGVVAAITLPSLTGNINERTWNTQRKALYARMSQAISLMPALNGYGELKEASSENASDTVDNATETFLTAGLSKVLKINNICDNEHLVDCGVVSSFNTMAGSKINIPNDLYELNTYFSSWAYCGSSYSTENTKAAAFETQNGESIVTYYNRNCKTQYLNSETLNINGHSFGLPNATMCANFIYDLNGSKGPNTIGKDMGIMTVFNATDSIVVAPVLSSASNADNGSGIDWFNATQICKTQDAESRLPNIDELSAMVINKDILNLTENCWFWSGSVVNLTRAWGANTKNGERATYEKIYTSSFHVRCVKR